MEKLRLSRIMARASTDEVRTLAQRIEDRHGVTVLKEPNKTLVMLPVREPSRGTVYYIGELLATEAMAEVEGARGMGVCMGADDAKAFAMAVVDAAFNAGVPECEALSEHLEALETEQAKMIAKEAALHAATRVSFSAVEGQ